MHQRFRFKDGRELLLKAAELGLDLPFDEDLSSLFLSENIDDHFIPNRLVVQPMEGYDSNPDGSPSQLTERRYLRYARGGSGIIWFEAIAVDANGRSNPRQLTINRGNTKKYKMLVEEMRKNSPAGTDPFMVAQITHSGRYSRPGGNPSPLVPQLNALLDKGSPRILEDDELKAIQDEMVSASGFVQEAGFDAVDIKACHGYLVNELLSSGKRMKSIYGGADPSLRFRFLLETIERIRAEYPELVVTTRLNISDVYPGGFGTDADGTAADLTEPMMLIGEIERRGVSLVNITMGSPYHNPHVVRPFDSPMPGTEPPDEHPLAGVVRMIEGTAAVQRAFPRMKMVGSAYSWLRQFAPNTGAAVIRSGMATFIGFGRNSFAYPSMPLDLMKNGRADEGKICITCSGCSRLIKHLRPGGCVTRDREIYGEELKNLVSDGKEKGEY